MRRRPPPDVRELLAERSAARAAGDFETADALRDRMRALGWEAVDGRGSSMARPALPDEPAGATGYARPEDLASLLDAPAAVGASVQVVAEDHPEDLERFLRGFAAHRPHDCELVVVANAPTFGLDPLLAGTEVTLLPTSERLGWADSRNLGLRRSRGEITIMVDTSLEPTGDFVTPLLAAFDDPHVGVAGGWGVVSADARQFNDAPPGEVDAVEGYCLAVRREVLRDAGLFERRFAFYRNADLDFSFQVRAAGWLAVRVDELPLERHEHRGYTAHPSEERDRLSKRNFYRFLKRWGDRRDLLLHPATPRMPADD